MPLDTTPAGAQLARLSTTVTVETGVHLDTIRLVRQTSSGHVAVITLRREAEDALLSLLQARQAVREQAAVR